MRANLNKNFGSSHDLKGDMKSIERRQEKSREVKKGRAPPPPASNQSNSRIKVELCNIKLKIYITFLPLLDDTTAGDASSGTANG